MAARRTKKQIVSGAFWTAAFLEFLLDEASKRGVGFDELYPLGDTSKEGQELREEIVRMVIARRPAKSVKVEEPKNGYLVSERFMLNVDRETRLEDQLAALNSGLFGLSWDGFTSANYPKNRSRPQFVELAAIQYHEPIVSFDALRNAVDELKTDGIERNGDPYELVAWLRRMIQVGVWCPIAALDISCQSANDPLGSSRTPVIDVVQERLSMRGVFFGTPGGLTRWKFLVVCGSK